MSKAVIQKREKRLKRKQSIRKRVTGSSVKPRVSVYRSSNHIYAQIIDDSTHKTVASFSDVSLKADKLKPIALATKVGEELGKKAKTKKIETVVFDRSGYKYHGRVKAVAEGLRAAGIKL